MIGRYGEDDDGDVQLGRLLDAENARQLGAQRKRKHMRDRLLALGATSADLDKNVGVFTIADNIGGMPMGHIVGLPPVDALEAVLAGAARFMPENPNQRPPAWLLTAHAQLKSERAPAQTLAPDEQQEEKAPAQRVALLPPLDEYVAKGYAAENYDAFLKAETELAVSRGFTVEVRPPTEEEARAAAALDAPGKVETLGGIELGTALELIGRCDDVAQLEKWIDAEAALGSSARAEVVDAVNARIDALFVDDETKADDDGAPGPKPTPAAAPASKTTKPHAQHKRGAGGHSKR